MKRWVLVAVVASTSVASAQPAEEEEPTRIFEAAVGGGYYRPFDSPTGADAGRGLSFNASIWRFYGRMGGEIGFSQVDALPWDALRRYRVLATYDLSRTAGAFTYGVRLGAGIELWSVEQTITQDGDGEPVTMQFDDRHSGPIVRAGAVFVYNVGRYGFGAEVLAPVALHTEGPDDQLSSYFVTLDVEARLVFQVR